MSRKLISIVLITTMLISTTIISMAAQGLPKPTAIIINGIEVSYDNDSGYPFVDKNNRTQVPFSRTMKAIGCEVNWVAETNTAVATKNGVKIEVPIGKSFIVKDGVQIPNDTVSITKEGRTYLPISAVLKSLGYDVSWDAGSNSVVVKDVSSNKSENNVVSDDSFMDFIANFTITVENIEDNGLKDKGNIETFVNCSYIGVNKNIVDFMNENDSKLIQYSKQIAKNNYVAPGLITVVYTNKGVELTTENIIYSQQFLNINSSESINNKSPIGGWNAFYE